jgi:hypothetical protein
VLYAPHGSLRRDLALGAGLGLIGGGLQWHGIEQSANDGIRHTLALGLAGGLVLMLVRLSTYVSPARGLGLLLLAALAMTLIITAIDYWTNQSGAPSPS